MADSATAPTAAPKPFQTKLVLLGEAAVGKSSVVLRFVSNEFAENKEPTIGAAFLTVSRSRPVADWLVRSFRSQLTHAFLPH